jgi:hypothetical protein
MKYLVIKPHRPSYREILSASKGAKLQFERKPTEWPGWLWCVDSVGKSGWVPESWVEIDRDTCTMLCDYSTRELTVNIGEFVDGEIIESGWIWIINKSGEKGWVPLECLEQKTLNVINYL